MDLTPFQQINPCGYENLVVTQVKDFMVKNDLEKIKTDLILNLTRILNYDKISNSAIEKSSYLSKLKSNS